MKKNLALFAIVFVGIFGFNSNAQDSLIQVNQFHVETPIEVTADLFNNITGKGGPASAAISWSIDYSAIDYLKSEGYTLFIKYSTSINAKRHKAGFENTDWDVISNISIDDTKYKLVDLAGGDKYVFKIGLEKGEQQVLSDKKKFKTEREWGLFKLLVLIGSLGLFIYGMKVMSEGLQQAAGSRLRSMLGSITSNRVKGVLTGFGITSIVQSSSVTTVMTVSFVNAGLLTLVQSAGVMMGANIGTTITAWLINIFGFKVSMASYAFIIIAIGAPLLFFGKSKYKAWANTIIGFALLFMGLGALKTAVPGLDADSGIVQFFAEYNNGGLLSNLMFVGLGTLATVIIQSSSAAMALTMTLVAAGVIPFEVAAAMILGENIGTTITAELASLIGNVHAKRSARIHSLFNIIGVFWALMLLPFMLDGIKMFMSWLGSGDPFTDSKEAANTGLAIFHTTFNLLNVLLLIGFVPLLVRLAERSVKSKGAADEEFHLDYIGTGIMGTADLSIFEAKKEVAKFGRITSRMSGFAQELLTEQNTKIRTKLYRKMAKYEEITDRVEIEVANYLAKVSKGEMTDETAKRVRAMNSIVNDLERIGDIFYQISKGIERKEQSKAYFMPEQRESLLEVFKCVDEAFEVMCDNLDADWGGVSLQAANDAEDKINIQRDKMRNQYLSDMNKKDFHMESGMIFSNLFSLAEKAGDHIINVSEAVTGKI
ncbi:MAG: Na/Pi cotransporter family protein [Crocinitomicaceae bacterium]